MHVYRVKTSIKHWSALLIGVLLAGIFAFAPAPAQAASDGWWPHFWSRSSVLPGFWITGEVTEVGEGSVTLELPNHRHAHGLMRHVSLQVELDVDDNSILLDGDLGPLDLSTLEAGDEVVVAPRLVWGNLVARLIFAGEPDTLAEANYRGELVADEGETLILENRRDGRFTVLVTEETIWYDNGHMERPAELPEEIKLRVLGAAEEDAEGEEVIRAILITPAK